MIPGRPERWSRAAALALPLLLFAGAAPRGLAAEKPEVLGESSRTARRLQEIAEKEKAARAKPSDERWAELIDELQALLASAGNDLVPTDDDHSVPARWLCHARIAALPVEALRLYRLRVE